MSGFSVVAGTEEEKLPPPTFFGCRKISLLSENFGPEMPKKCALKTPPFWGTLKAELSLLALIISSIIREFAAI